MPRKKIEPIESLGSNVDKLTVQKSQPLFALWRSEMTLAEFKILDTYLARIDSHKPEKRAVTFEKGQLESLLGVKKINLSDLKDRLKHLMGNVVEVPDPSVKKGIRLVTLFEEAIAEQDDFGIWQIKLECTQKAMKYFFNIENLGYLRYKLRCITSLTSRYTYIMFVYLESNRFRKSWEVGLEELKQILDCDKVETYSAFKEFNKQVLKRVQKEMNEKTECRYSYEPIKKGRSVVAIRFTLETLQKSSIENIDLNSDILEKYQGTGKELWESALDEFNFSKEQIAELREVLIVIPDHILPPSPAGYGSLEFRRYHYMQIKMTEIKRRNTENPIRSTFSYLLKMMKQDAKQEY